MKKTYEITGMSCGGCVNSVKQALLQNQHIQHVDVQLNPQSAVITMSKAISVTELQAQLTKVGPYAIKEVNSI